MALLMFPVDQVMSSRTVGQVDGGQSLLNDLLGACRTLSSKPPKGTCVCELCELHVVYKFGQRHQNKTVVQFEEEESRQPCWFRSRCD